MHNPRTINPVWPDRTVVVTVAASSVSATLPTLPDGSTPERVAITAGAAFGVSITLTSGTVALASASEGITYYIGQPPLILDTRGMSTINTWATGAGKLHVTPLEN